MPKLNPINVLIKYQKIIMETYYQNNNRPKATWECLQNKLPELSNSMSFNTFKQYLSVFLALLPELDKVIQEKNLIAQKLETVKSENHNLKNKLQSTSQKLYKVIQEENETKQNLKTVTQQNTELKDKTVNLKIELDKVIQKGEIDKRHAQTLDNQPKKINNWNIQKAKDGYYRCYRKIDKKVHSIYIGKTLDIQKAQRRISEKEQKIGLYKVIQNKT